MMTETSGTQFPHRASPPFPISFHFICYATTWKRLIWSRSKRGDDLLQTNKRLCHFFFTIIKKSQQTLLVIVQTKISVNFKTTRSFHMFIQNYSTSFVSLWDEPPSPKIYLFNQTGLKFRKNINVLRKLKKRGG